MKKKTGIILLALICFLFLAPIAFANAPMEIRGEEHVRNGQQYEYQLINIQEQPKEIIWYLKDSVEGVSIENSDNNQKAKIYISDQVNVESITLMVKIKKLEDNQNAENSKEMVSNSSTQEIIVSKIINIEQSQKTSIISETIVADEVNIDMTFKDTIFAKYIKDHYDLDHSGGLSEDEIAKVNIINIKDLEMKTLKGIETFDDLISLTLYNVPVDELDVHSFSKLMSLSCQQMPLKKLIIQNQAIGTLKINNTQLTTLNLKGNPSLTSVDCSQNDKLNLLEFDESSKITTLNCKLSAFTSLDIGLLKELSDLECGNNPLTSLDLTQNTKLEYLSVSNCQSLASLNVTQCPKLLNLYAGTNVLKELDVTHNPLLTILNVSSNQLQNLDLSHNTQLKNLDIMQNSLSSIDVSQNTQLSSCQTLGYQQIDVHFQYDTSKRKWISQPISFLDTKVFSGSAFTSSSNSMMYDNSTKCFVIPKAQKLSAGTMKSTFILPGNQTSKNLNANLNFHFLCLVDFNTMGGTPKPEKLQVEYGKLITEPTQPTRQGYTFAGWYQDENMREPWDFESDFISQNTMLYIKWTLQQYQVRFHHPDKDIAAQMVDYQGFVKEPEVYQKENYVFKGWFTDSNFEYQWHFSTQQVTNDLDLYASYQEVVQTPKSNVVSGSKMKKGQQIVLSSETAGAKIYYTVDGTQPTSKSFLYTQPIVLEKNMVISAIAIKENCLNSKISIFQYTIQSIGKADVVIKVDGKNNVTVRNDESVLDAILTNDDYSAYHDGQDILITLDCQTIETSQEIITDDLIKGYQIGQYLDITIYKQIGNLKREIVTQLNHPIQLTLQVPEELLPQNGKRRTYSVLRIHDSESVILSDLDQTLSTITIESDRFSTYVILYQDEKETIVETVENIRTEDDSQLIIYIGLLLVTYCVGVSIYYFSHKG